MLSIGRGLMGNPDLMIFDEPSLGLAPILVEQNFEIIKKINERGTTVLLVEQNAGLTLEISTYGYVLQKGKIIVEGTAAELEHNEMVVAAYLS
jgi:branched-chain amino acid transport system ATP-binding protein